MHKELRQNRCHKVPHCLQEALHVAAGQSPGHTALVPAPLHQILVKCIFKLKRCDISNNSKCEAVQESLYVHFIEQQILKSASRAFLFVPTCRFGAWLIQWQV